jgi:hypothetical protein
MAIRPEDRGKILLLSVAIVALTGYFIAAVLPRLINRDGDIPVVATAAGYSAARPSSVPAEQAAGASIQEFPSQSPLADLDVENSPPGPATRDPFRPPAPVRLAKTEVPGASPPRVTPPPTLLREQAHLNALPLLRGSSSLLFGSRSVAPAEIGPPPVPLVQLKGVVMGNPTIAVMSMDGQTFSKQVGERIAMGWSVASISEAGIVLKGYRESIVLGVGHSTEGYQNRMNPAPAAPLRSQDPRLMPDEMALRPLEAPPAGFPAESPLLHTPPNAQPSPEVTLTAPEKDSRAVVRRAEPHRRIARRRGIRRTASYSASGPRFIGRRL